MTRYAPSKSLSARALLIARTTFGIPVQSTSRKRLARPAVTAEGRAIVNTISTLLSAAPMLGQGAGETERAMAVGLARAGLLIQAVRPCHDSKWLIKVL